MTPTDNGSTPASGEWPTVPPAPAPVRPNVALAPPEPPNLGAGTATATAGRGQWPDEEPPTIAFDTSGAILSRPHRPHRNRLFRPDTSPVAVLQESARRRMARAAPDRRREIVWQPRFAYGSAAVILLALTVISMPLWIVLWRITGATETDPGEIIAICMMLMGGFLTAAALWAILVEMRGRIRMVDTLARSGEREALFAADPAAVVLDESSPPQLTATAPQPPAGPLAAQLPVSLPAKLPPQVPAQMPARVPAHIAARAEAEQAGATAMLEASSQLLASFSGVLRAFGQLPAQVATLAVALALFVGATILSLH